MSLRILLDEDLSQRVATGLRARGVDALSVHELNRAALPDEEQLSFAAAEGRVLVTYNRADYQLLDAEWRAEGRIHCGILWGNERSIPRHAFGELIRALELIDRDTVSLAGLCLPLGRKPI